MSVFEDRERKRVKRALRHSTEGTQESPATGKLEHNRLVASLEDVIVSADKADTCTEQCC